MSVCFLLRESGRASEAAVPLPAGMALRVWRPRLQSGLPLLPFDPLRLAVWLQDRCGLFADDRYTEVSIWQGSVRLHRLVVTPRWHRFPFMEHGDLQIGALWTHPSWRRQGLASLAMQHAHRIFDAPGQRFWYVADESNAASTALALTSGYRLVGEGRRTRPGGLSLLGRFELERLCAES